MKIQFTIPNACDGLHSYSQKKEFFDMCYFGFNMHIDETYTELNINESDVETLIKILIDFSSLDKKGYIFKLILGIDTDDLTSVLITQGLTQRCCVEKIVKVSYKSIDYDYKNFK